MLNTDQDVFDIGQNVLDVGLDDALTVVNSRLRVTMKIGCDIGYMGQDIGQIG